MPLQAPIRLDTSRNKIVQINDTGNGTVRTQKRGAQRAPFFLKAWLVATGELPFGALDSAIRVCPIKPV
jgi:hypothetical protein